MFTPLGVQLTPVASQPLNLDSLVSLPVVQNKKLLEQIAKLNEELEATKKSPHASGLKYFDVISTPIMSAEAVEVISIVQTVAEKKFSKQLVLTVDEKNGNILIAWSCPTFKWAKGLLSKMMPTPSLPDPKGSKLLPVINGR